MIFRKCGFVAKFLDNELKGPLYLLRQVIQALQFDFLLPKERFESIQVLLNVELKRLKFLIEYLYFSLKLFLKTWVLRPLFFPLSTFDLIYSFVMANIHQVTERLNKFLGVISGGLEVIRVIHIWQKLSSCYDDSVVEFAALHNL